MVLVVGGANLPVYVAAGGVALFYQPFSLECLNGTNGCVPRDAAGFGDGLIAWPADLFLSGAGNQIAVNRKLDRCQPELKDAVRHPVISTPIRHACPPPFYSPT